MKEFKRPAHPYRQMILGIVLILTGISMLFSGEAYSVPSDYNINAFDAIFIVPMLIKIFYYEILETVAGLGVFWGLVSIAGGIFCVVPVILSEPDPTDYFSMDDFATGDAPNETELRQMLESGEITKEEYNEIRQYARQKRRK